MISPIYEHVYKLRDRNIVMDEDDLAGEASALMRVIQLITSKPQDQVTTTELDACFAHLNLTIN